MIYRNIPDWPFRQPKDLFQNLAQIRQRFDQLLDYRDFPAIFRTSGVFPSVNITQDKQNYYIRAELPGIKPENLDITSTGNSISLFGERTSASEENARYHRREREAGKFSRAITLPGEIDPDRISAQITDGILTITAAKAEKAQPRKITVG